MQYTSTLLCAVAIGFTYCSQAEQNTETKPQPTSSVVSFPARSDDEIKIVAGITSSLSTCMEKAAGSRKPLEMINLLTILVNTESHDQASRLLTTSLIVQSSNLTGLLSQVITLESGYIEVDSLAGRARIAGSLKKIYSLIGSFAADWTSAKLKFPSTANTPKKLNEASVAYDDMLEVVEAAVKLRLATAELKCIP